MQALEFLATVLPPPGHGFYCVAELGRRKQHVFDQSLERVLDAATHFDERGLDSYFAVSTFTSSENRLADNAAFIRSFFIDIDCGDAKFASGKGYATQRDGVAALQKALVGTPLGELGTPWVVSSGGGLHVYWALEEAVTIAQWKPVAEKLKRWCESKGLLCDYGLSANAACVLRPPETHNYKLKDNPRPVKIKITGTPAANSFQAISDALGYAPPAARELPPFDDIFGNIAGVKLVTPPPHIPPGLVGTQSRFKLIFKSSLAGQGCDQIKYYAEHAQSDGLEPLWRAVLSTAKACVDGEASCERISGLHPYDEQRMLQKLREIKGPYNCTSYDSANPGVCRSCPNFGKITNPIALGREMAPVLAPFTPAEAPVEAAPVVAPGAHPVLSLAAFLPNNASLSPQGVFWREGSPPGEPPNPTVRMCAVPFFLAGVYDDSDVGAAAHWVLLLADGSTRDILIPMSKLVGKDDTTKVLAEYGLMALGQRDQYLRSYVRGSMERAMGLPMQHVPKNLGWQAGGESFAYAGQVYYPGGRRRVPMPTLDNLSSSTVKSGTLDDWRSVWQLFASIDRFDIVTMGLVGFASTLMRFTGYSGCTFHACANGSGTGKTLSLKLACSAWGDPLRFKVTPDTSAVATINRLGFLGSLPLCCDEITHKSRNTSEWFPEFLSRMSEGKGKDRMEASTNSERRNTTTWSTLALMTSNKHMVDYLTAERKHQSEGELRRLLEMPLENQLHLDVAQRKIVGRIEHSFGHAGEIWANWLVNNLTLVAETVRASQSYLFDKFIASSDERFWIAACAAVHAAAKLVGQAGILSIDQSKVTSTLFGIVTHMREQMSKTKRKADDLFMEFLRENNGHFVVVTKMLGKATSIAYNGVSITEVLPRTEVLGRVDRDAGNPTFCEVTVPTSVLTRYCSSISYSYELFIAHLREKRPVVSTSRDLMAGAAGVPLRLQGLTVTMHGGELDGLL